MFNVSARTLVILAALIWVIGGLVLLGKGGSLLLEAEALQPGETQSYGMPFPWPWLALVAALLLGSLKARYLFAKSCRKNLVRIAALDRPRLWQFFRPGFFLLLAVMIAAGATLSRLAQGSYPFLIAAATLDLSIAVALLGSSSVFLRNKRFAKQPVGTPPATESGPETSKTL